MVRARESTQAGVRLGGEETPVRGDLGDVRQGEVWELGDA